MRGQRQIDQPRPHRVYSASLDLATSMTGILIFLESKNLLYHCITRVVGIYWYSTLGWDNCRTFFNNNDALLLNFHLRKICFRKQNCCLLTPAHSWFHFFWLHEFLVIFFQTVHPLFLASNLYKESSLTKKNIQKRVLRADKDHTNSLTWKK